MAPDSCCGGPGWASPKEASEKGPREELLYVVCVRKSHDESLPDYIATVDTDPKSKTYSQVIHRTFCQHAEDELHHTGWNACSSCHGDKGQSRDRLVAPAINTSRVNVFDVGTDPRKPTLCKVVDPGVFAGADVANPHTVHCLGSKQVMISTMGDNKGNAKGSFVLLDNQNFEFQGLWGKDQVPFGYDFWYQPRHNIMVSTEWGTWNKISNGFNPEDVAKGLYGSKVHFWNWQEQTLIKSVDMGDEGRLSLEVRLFHEPTKAEGYVGNALSNTVFYLYKDQAGEWQAKRVIKVPELPVSGWAGGDLLPGIISDILISLDDRFLYVSNWLLGELHQYSLEDPENPKLVGKIRIGGFPSVTPGITSTDPDVVPYRATVVNGKTLHGGPQMVQLSLDGKRLYVSTSLYSVWDNQFYPGLSKTGGDILMVEVDTDKGGLSLCPHFHVDMGKEPGGPAVAHEMRYPGGDCSSDIWL